MIAARAARRPCKSLLSTLSDDVDIVMSRSARPLASPPNKIPARLPFPYLNPASPLFSPPQVIPPSGNTRFDVVFLGREEGPVENTLYIHTSAGSFRFVVRAEGTPNPYRLKPLVGVRMPVNSSYSPLIQMHNPHSEPIQVRDEGITFIVRAREQLF